MADPITTAIATAVASGIGQTLSDQARESLAALVRRIREKFRQRPAAQAAFDAALETPDSAMRVSEFAHALEKASAEDAEFGSEIREFWSDVHLALEARDGAVMNNFRGRADKVIQLRDVHGDINIS